MSTSYKEKAGGIEGTVQLQKKIMVSPASSILTVLGQDCRKCGMEKCFANISRSGGQHGQSSANVRGRVVRVPARSGRGSKTPFGGKIYLVVERKRATTMTRTKETSMFCQQNVRMRTEITTVNFGFIKRLWCKSN